MVPRTSSGRGFKGAAAYYLHDKGADTADRVRFTQTLNLANDTPDRAVNEMCYTAEHQADIKAAAGGASVGRKLVKPVYTFSLSWHTSENPTDQQMRDAAGDALRALKMSDYQALIVAHNDTDHPHLHVMVNRVHPETGIAHDLKNDHLTLSKWAEKYELDHGKTWCLERVKNNAERHRATPTREPPTSTVARVEGRALGSFAEAAQQRPFGFVKDRKSQARDRRPEYDRRAASILARAAARQVQQQTAEAKRQAQEQRQRDFVTWAHDRRNALQDRHRAEEDDRIRADTSRRAVNAHQAELAYGDDCAAMREAITSLDTRQRYGSFVSRAVDRLRGVDRQRAVLEKSLHKLEYRFRAMATAGDQAAAVDREKFVERQQQERNALESSIERGIAVGYMIPLSPHVKEDAGHEQTVGQQRSRRGFER